MQMSTHIGRDKNLMGQEFLNFYFIYMERGILPPLSVVYLPGIAYKLMLLCHSKQKQYAIKDNVIMCI